MANYAFKFGKKIPHVAGVVGVAMSVRPLGSVHMTAGDDALRGSGPVQKPAFDDAIAQVGCVGGCGEALGGFAARAFWLARTACWLS
jgi:hypothetical protein